MANGEADVLARDSSGQLWFYARTMTGFGRRISLGTSWAGYYKLTSRVTFRATWLGRSRCPAVTLTAVRLWCRVPAANRPRCRGHAGR